MICVREYFRTRSPLRSGRSSRWIIGIVYQGFRTHRWTSDGTLNYFLWRDRKGGITNVVSFLATLVLLQLAAIWAYEALLPGGDMVLSLFEGDRWLAILLTANLVLIANRLTQRMFFVSSYYGLIEDPCRSPVFWGNVINFMANCGRFRRGSPMEAGWCCMGQDHS